MKKLFSFLLILTQAICIKGSDARERIELAGTPFFAVANRHPEKPIHSFSIYHEESPDKLAGTLLGGIRIFTEDEPKTGTRLISIQTSDTVFWSFTQEGKSIVFHSILRGYKE